MKIYSTCPSLFFPRTSGRPLNQIRLIKFDQLNFFIKILRNLFKLYLMCTLCSSREPVAGHSSCRQPSGGTVETISRGGRGHKSTNLQNALAKIHKIHLYKYTNPLNSLAQTHKICKSTKSTCLIFL